jgi:tetratricopeptide (TPR) repeat protein
VELLERVVAIDEKAFGPEHEEIATDLNNLASVYRAQKRYEKAEALYQRALAICRQQWGLEHPNTANCINNIGLLYFKQERFKE